MKKVSIDELNESMYLSKPEVSNSGVIMGSEKQRVIGSLSRTLKNYSKNRKLKEMLLLYN